MRFGMLLFPRLTQLDLAGPYEVLARIPGSEILLVWKTREAVISDTGMPILPTSTFDDCPQLDIVFVPGGPGQVTLMEDEQVLQFLRAQAENALYVTSVCTGSLVLAAAGLLNGYRAACHWMSRDVLRSLGVEVLTDRCVIDRNRVTAGGVTAGIDFGLRLAALLSGEEEAKRIQLLLEYDPAPPFDAGSPERAGAQIEAAVREQATDLQAGRKNVVARIRSRATGS
jgi:cyclohexyl-isocyanide hydratase